MQPKNDEKEGKKEPPYLGNIWGWNFSIFSAILLLVVILLTIPQQCAYMETGSQEIQKEKTLED